MTDEAADYIDKLNFLGAAGMEVAMTYMQGVDMVMSLYEALTGGGRGAIIAHTIMNYHNQAELDQWILAATRCAWPNVDDIDFRAGEIQDFGIWSA